MTDDDEFPDYANMTGEKFFEFVPPGWNKPYGQMTKEDLLKLAEQEQERGERLKARAEAIRARLTKGDSLDS